MTIPRRVHFVGIGGAGMSGLARVLLQDGRIVSGSDRQMSDELARLRAMGAAVTVGHDAAAVAGAELVVRTAAVPLENVEVDAALRSGIPVIKRAEMLGELMAERRGIAIAGTHGKTTTSAMVAAALLRSGADPTALIGGDVPELGGTARRGAGEWLVAEADEYDRSFHWLRPEIAVITNVEADHMDIYADLQDVYASFRQFIGRVSGELIVWSGDPFLAQVAAARGALATTYGSPGADWEAIGLERNANGCWDFALHHLGRRIGAVSLQIPGQHNVLNALAALAASYAAGCPVVAATEALRDFRGVKRRQEVVGEAAGVLVVDDYAHHPTEVRATLRALRERWPERRIVCLFQPHTFSRTRVLMDEMASAFADADDVLVTDIYAAREQNSWGVTSEELAAAAARTHPAVRYTGSLHESVAAAVASAAPGALIVTMGAGDVTSAGRQILDLLESR